MEPDGRQVSVVDAKTAILAASRYGLVRPSMSRCPRSWSHDRTVVLANALRKASTAEWATTPEHPWLGGRSWAGLSALSSLVSGRWTVPGAQGRTHPPTDLRKSANDAAGITHEQTITR